MHVYTNKRIQTISNHMFPKIPLKPHGHPMKKPANSSIGAPSAGPATDPSEPTRFRCAQRCLQSGTLKLAHLWFH